MVINPGALANVLQNLSARYFLTAYTVNYKLSEQIKSGLKLDYNVQLVD